MSTLTANPRQTALDTIRVFVADDHVLVREGLCLIIESAG